VRIEIINPSKALNKAYFKQSLKREQIETFKTQLVRLFERINEKESEEHLKNIVSDFLKDTYYKHINEINTKGRKDLVIHNGAKSTDAVAVIIEAKKPGNPEMITSAKPNAKALHELLHYYLNERFINNNKELKYLIITNMWEWYIFDAQDFEKLFFENKKLLKEYEEWNQKNLVGTTTEWFYEQSAKPFIEKEIDSITAVYFDLKRFEKLIRSTNDKDDEALINLYKILSPEHLLKKSFANDSNSLNREFYNELLHIIGLEEIKEGSKKLIQRKSADRRNEGSLVENAINVLKRNQRDATLTAKEDVTENELYSFALELCITWLNRILFLKLMEGQLIQYHNGNEIYKFLNNERVKDFDELDELFFEVLAVPEEKRSSSVKSKFHHIPYLNSSLFEETGLEKKLVYISGLKDRLEMPTFTNTVLKDAHGKRITGTKNTLHYLFEFLSAYDFASDTKAKIQEQNKTIINASVLGLIFEKINGYKDGSFFTPGFITMYMCRETVRRAAVQKFKDSGIAEYKNVETFEELKDKIEYTDKTVRKEANEIINSLHICDPAVGSGHFLVSALNELIEVKHELRVLNYRDGSRIKGYTITIANDELIITDEEADELFSYNLNQHNKPFTEKQQLQEALFHEKKTIIENCLFGVDINPKSVLICRLRLWIELLKNDYYITGEDHQLQTLPNIDINIKCGNSLISRFALDADLKQALKSIKFNINDYKKFVYDYKNEQDKEVKHGLEKIINEIKNNFRTQISQNDPKKKRLDKLIGELYYRFTGNFLFEDEPEYGKNKKDSEEKVKLEAEIEKLNKKLDEYKNNVVYQNSFEWRFEFPEVLDDDGNFIGFDVVIGNPPYVTGPNAKADKEYYKANYKTAEYQLDLYVFFIERSHQILYPNGIISLITPNSWLKNLKMESCRKFILEKFAIQSIHSNISNAFEEAQVDTMIFIAKKENSALTKNHFVAINAFFNNISYFKRNIIQSRFEKNEGYVFDVEVDETKLEIMKKVRKKSKKMYELFEITRGVNPYDAYTGQSQEIIKNKAYHSSYKKDSSFLPELRGKHIFKYGYLWDEKHYISYGKWLAAPREEKFFKGERILFREILGENNFICTVINEDFIVDRSLYIALPKKGTNSKYVLGILASRLLGWYFKHDKNEFDSLFPKIRVEEFRNLPIKSLEAQQPFITLVDQILSAKKQNPLADTSVLERQIDLMVYHLYDLTYDEVKLIDETVSKEEYFSLK
jgi:hypothetical protein